MSESEDVLAALREAVRLAPDNSALRLHLASTLLDWNRAREAIEEFRHVLRGAPESVEAKLGLARAFYAAGRQGEARVVLDGLLASGSPPAAAVLLDARLLHDEGDTGAAEKRYREAVGLDPSLADPDFAQALEAPSATVPAGPRLPEAVAADGSLVADVERPRISFRDVGGMDSLKEEIRMKVIHPMTHPELFEAYGKRIGGGILLYGPPGCGKTYLARATAGEAKTGFLTVALHDILDMWLGSSERRLHQLFQTARTHHPCVLFIDEVDALGSKRSDLRSSALRTTINQFLHELDGATHSNEGVLVLAATNAPWHIDSAFLRPGRFDRILFVPPPDDAARGSILDLLLRGRPTATLDLRALAKETRGFSGADLKAVVDIALEAKLELAMRAGRPVPLTQADLRNAVSRVRPSTTEWFATARNYALYANEGGLYDGVLSYLRR